MNNVRLYFKKLEKSKLSSKQKEENHKDKSSNQ